MNAHVRMLIASAICGAPAMAQQAVEVSEDGLLTATPGSEPARAIVNRAGFLPFGTTPDYELVLRRQIGGLQIADVNDDGLNDIVAACYSSSSFPPYDDWHEFILVNTGSGPEATPSWVSTVQTHTGDLIVGDVTGDTLPDIVTIHGGGLRTDNVRIYYGVSGALPSTTPSWTSATSPNAWGTSGLLVDLDKDGDLDLVTTNQGLSPDPYRPIFQFENNAGVLETSPSWTSAAAEISNGLDAADYDGDSWVDVGVAKWVNWESAIYKNNGGTLLTTPTWTRGETDADKGAAFADVDANGWPDFGIGGDNSTLWSNDSGVLTNTWTANPPYSGPQEVHFWDADGDGDQDFFEVHFADGRAHLYLNEGGVLATDPSWTYDAPEVGTALAFGDLNGDGIGDLAIGYSGDTCIRVFYGQTPPCPADIDGNGSLNLDDVNLFAAAFVGGDLAADIDGNGVLNLDDVNLFAASFVAGCP